MDHGQRAFTVRETHGILWMPRHRVESSSDGLGWLSLYASMQREQPYESTFGAVDDHLIIVHRDGPVRIDRDLCGDRLNRVVQPGGLFILPAGRDFAVKLGGTLSTIHLYVRSDFIRRAAEELATGDPDKIEIVPRLGERDALIEQAAYSVCEMVRDQVRGEWFAESVARSLAVRLVLHHSTAACKPTLPEEALSQKRLNAVADFVEAHLGDSITLADIAGAAALSPIHFARQFKKATGETPHQYLLKARVEAAKRFLRSDLTIAEIAFRCGFSHQEHLTKVFGRMVGLTPAAYRRTVSH